MKDLRSPHRAAAAALLLATLSLSACDGSDPISSDDDPGAEGRIVFSTFEPATGRWGVSTVGLDGSDPVPLPVQPENEGGIPDMVFFDFQWSPDGRHLLYRSSRTNTDDWALTLVDADGSDKRFLTNPDEFAVDGSWSPTGDRILYSRGGFFAERAGFAFQTAVVDLEGRSTDVFIADDGKLFQGRTVHFSLLPIADSSRFDPVPALYEAAFAPNGRDLLVLGSIGRPLWSADRRAEDVEIFRVSVATGRVLERVTRNGVDETGFLLSDDGRRILLTRPQGPDASPVEFRLHTLSLPGGTALTRITEEFHDHPVRWASDARHVIFARPERPDGGEIRIVVVDADRPGSERVVLRGGSRPDLFVTRPAGRGR